MNIVVLICFFSVVWDEGREVYVGLFFLFLIFYLVLGVVFIEFYSGVRVVFEGLVEFELVFKNYGCFKIGKFYVYVFL